MVLFLFSCFPDSNQDSAKQSGAIGSGGHDRRRGAELRSAVPQIWNPQTPLLAGRSGRAGRPAECSSAAQQIENLCYL